MPDTNCIKFCDNVGLYNNYENTIDFATLTDQTNFWNSKVKTSYSLENTKWITKNKFRCAFNYNAVKDFSYAFFENVIDSTVKRTYCFILNCELIGNGVVEFTYEEDVLQTYMFDYSLKESFVEREHQDRYALNEDETKLIPVYNTKIESLESGNEFVIDSSNQLKPSNLPNAYDNIYWLCAIFSDEITLPTTFYSLNTPEVAVNNKLGMSLINGVPTGAYTYYIPIAPTSSYKIYNKVGSSNYVSCATYNTIDDLMSNSNLVSLSIFKNPPFNITMSGNNIYINMDNVSNFRGVLFENTVDVTCAFIELKNIPNTILSSINSYVVTFDRYKSIGFININTDKNIANEPKLDTREFSYLECSIGSNFKQQYNIEDFYVEEDLNFKFIPSISVNNSCLIFPLYYQDNDVDFASIISQSLFSLPVVQSAWKDYLANNKNALETGFTTQAIQTATSVATGAVSSNNLSGFLINQGIDYATQIASQMAKIEDLKSSPNKVIKSAIDCYADLIVNNLKIFIKKFTIKSEFKQAIFNYFYHFGYSCKELKIPNLRSRYYFNYIKTVGVELVGNINNTTLEKIKSIFNKGFTIWHYRDSTTFKYLDYTKENVEMSLL